MEQVNRKEIMEMYKQLRVADVRDGMDWMMLHHVGNVSPEIRPLWRTRFCGFARTVQYVPTQRTIPACTPDEYDIFVHKWYHEVCTYPFESDIEPDDVIVIDAGNTNVGIIGSNNSLSYMMRGARGIVTNGGARDTDEIILQKVPLFSRYVSTTMVQGRVEYRAKDVPVNIGGALVRPGDLIVADGDGIVVVPIERAMDVAKYAMREMENDKKSRRAFYERMGIPLDHTV